MILLCQSDVDARPPPSTCCVCLTVRYASSRPSPRKTQNKGGTVDLRTCRQCLSQLLSPKTALGGGAVMTVMMMNGTRNGTGRGGFAEPQRPYNPLSCIAEKHHGELHTHTCIPPLTLPLEDDMGYCRGLFLSLYVFPDLYSTLGRKFTKGQSCFGIIRKCVFLSSPVTSLLPNLNTIFQMTATVDSFDLIILSGIILLRNGLRD